MSTRPAKTRLERKNDAVRANLRWKTQDFTQAELRRRLDGEARGAGFSQPAILIKQAPKPPA